jgi:hypothetical protein
MSVTLAVSVESAQASARLSQASWSLAQVMAQAIPDMEEVGRRACGFELLGGWMPFYQSMGRAALRVAQAARIALAFQLDALRREGISPPPMEVGGELGSLMPMLRSERASRWQGHLIRVEQPEETAGNLDRLARWHRALAGWLQKDYAAILSSALGWAGYAQLGLEEVVRGTGGAIVAAAGALEGRAVYLAGWAEQIRSLRQRIYGVYSEVAGRLYQLVSGELVLAEPIMSNLLTWHLDDATNAKARSRMMIEKNKETYGLIRTATDHLASVWTGAQGAAAAERIREIALRGIFQSSDVAIVLEDAAVRIEALFREYLDYLNQAHRFFPDRVPYAEADLGEERAEGMVWTEASVGVPTPA